MTSRTVEESQAPPIAVVLAWRTYLREVQAEMKRVAQLIDKVLTTPDEATVTKVKGEVEELSLIHI